MSVAYLLDASALLALIFNEPGADQVRVVLDRSRIHSVNLIEVVRKMVALGIPAPEVEENLAALNLVVLESLNSKQAFAVGCLGLDAKRFGLSLGDCVCLAMAQWHNLKALTTDRRWSEVPGYQETVIQVR